MWAAVIWGEFLEVKGSSPCREGARHACEREAGGRGGAAQTHTESQNSECPLAFQLEAEQLETLLRCSRGDCFNLDLHTAQDTVQGSAGKKAMFLRPHHKQLASFARAL